MCRDYDRGVVLEQLGAQDADDLILCCCVEPRRGLVEQQDRRPPHQCPGQSDPLALSARERLPAFGEEGLVALREAHDHVVHSRRAGGCLDLLVGGVGASVANVLGDREAEENRFLENQRDL